MAGISKLVRLAFGVVAGLLVFAPAAIAKPQPGDLDRSFGGRGVVRTHVDGQDGFPGALAIDPSHRIVAIGGNSNGFLLARYKPNGKLDPAFSGDGMQSVAFRDLEPSDRAGALGKGRTITVAGVTCPPQGRCQISVARLTAGGGLDGSFGNAGKVAIHLDGLHTTDTSLVVDSRGRAVIGATVCRKKHCGFELMRLKQDGKLDPRFGKDGRVTTNLVRDGRRAYVNLGGMATDSHGRILAAGSVSDERVALVRYTKTGDRSRSFGHDGVVVKHLDRLGGINGIAITPKDKLVAAGPYQPDGRRKWALARFGRKGGLNRSFGNGGQATVHIPATGNDEVEGLAIDSKNRIVVTGKPDYSLARFQPNGKLNRSFGHRGTVTKEFGGFSGAVAIDSRNRPVIAGQTFPDFTVARFIG